MKMLAISYLSTSPIAYGVTKQALRIVTRFSISFPFGALVLHTPNKVIIASKDAIPIDFLILSEK